VTDASRLLEFARDEATKPSPDNAAAIVALEEASSLGLAEAQYALGTWYLHGVGMKKNLVKAAEYFRAAADQDHPSAQFDLAICYEKGTGVEKKARAAFELYMRSALGGDAGAFSEVARCWHYGIGIAADERLAEVWYEKAESLDGSAKK
jgi:TPR repeat protein